MKITTIKPRNDLNILALQFITFISTVLLEYDISSDIFVQVLGIQENKINMTVKRLGGAYGAKVTIFTFSWLLKIGSYFSFSAQIPIFLLLLQLWPPTN